LLESNKWIVIASAVTGFWLLYLLSPILSPFIIAATLAYIGDPFVDKLESLKLSRTMAVACIFVVFALLLFIILLILFPLAQKQLQGLIQVLPSYIDFIQNNVLPNLLQKIGFENEAFDLSIFKEAISKYWVSVGGLAGKIIASISESSMALLLFLTNLVLIPVIGFYLLRDWDILVENIHNLLPRSIEGKVAELVIQSDEVLSAFIRGQLSVMVALGTIYSVGLWFIDLNFSLLIGMLAGTVSFVPYLGFIVGFSVAIVASIMQFQDLSLLIPISLVFMVGQMIESMLLTPLLVGDKIGLHPVAVIFAIMAGGQLFGFVGVLVALPISAVIMVLIRHMLTHYKQSTLYQESS